MDFVPPRAGGPEPGVDYSSAPLLVPIVEGTVHGRPWPWYMVKVASMVNPRRAWRSVKKDFRAVYEMPGCVLGMSFAAKDELLEWAWPQREDVARMLRRLGLTFSLSMNFSSYADAPRMEVIHNRLRTQESVSLFRAQGIATVPHVEGTHPEDFEAWASWLRADRTPAVCLNMQLHRRSVTFWHRSLDELLSVLRDLRHSPVVLLYGVASPQRAATALRRLAGWRVRFLSSNPFSAARYYWEYRDQSKERRLDLSRLELFRRNMTHWYAEVLEWLRLRDGPSADAEAIIRADMDRLRSWEGLPDPGGPYGGGGRRSDVRANMTD